MVNSVLRQKLYGYNVAYNQQIGKTIIVLSFFLRSFNTPRLTN